jgi:glyoxylase-like metal-dependent hydrolase (beta-lactamase superfamily II)
VKQLADGVWQLDGFPPNNTNVYVIGDVVIDAAMAFDKRRILKQVKGMEINAHAITHAHFDHTGSSHAICEALNIPMWAGADDAEAVEKGKMRTRFRVEWLPSGKAHPVARRLKEGDEVGGFTVLDTPGHSPGHIVFWRESDRTLVCGDVMFGYNPFLLMGGLMEPPQAFSFNPAQNRASARRIADLEPALVCFGHGPPLRDPAKFKAAVAKLRAD